MQFIQPVDRSTVRALIWERGAGWTLASGTSSCAVAAACVRAGLVDRNVSVVMPGGTLEVASARIGSSSRSASRKRSRAARSRPIC